MPSRRLVCCLVSIGIIALADSATAADLAGYYGLFPLFGNKELNTEEQEYVERPREEAAPVVIALYACGAGDFCGRIAAPGWLGDADSRNPTPAARERKLCGLEVLRLHASSDRKRAALWRGKLYDPRRGDTVAVAISVDLAGNLVESGHAGTPVLSRSYARGIAVWPRVTPADATCERAQPAS